MRKGFSLVIILLVIGGVLTVFGGGYISARSEKLRIFEFLKKDKEPKKEAPKSSPASYDSPTNKVVVTGRSPSPIASIASPTPTAALNQTGSSSKPTVYSQPQGKYKLTLPGDWVVNSTNATFTYSTTKFTGPNGYVAITFGGGKDPIGGCSETSSVTLADRTASGCFLLQKDGSQILTRVYTKDKTGIEFTIEAYMNSPLSYHRPVVLDVIKTIDIE